MFKVMTLRKLFRKMKKKECHSPFNAAARSSTTNRKHSLPQLWRPIMSLKRRTHFNTTVNYEHAKRKSSIYPQCALFTNRN